MRLYPRLQLAQAAAFSAAFRAMTPETLRARRPPPLAGQRFAPTGGQRVTDADLSSLRTDVELIADDEGFPVYSQAAGQSFDRRVARLLGEKGFPPGEMLRAETWAWITVNLLPHLVQWRFGGAEAIVTPSRFAGSLQRNAIGRLWFRAWVFDRGPEAPSRFELVDRLSEDAFVAILERTTIASDHRLARVLAECWLSRRADSLLSAEDLLRRVAVRVRVLAVVRELNVLDEQELREVIDNLAEVTADRLHQPTSAGV